MQVRLDQIEFDENIYPRKKIKHKTVENYFESLKASAVFPPIEVQRVRYDDGGEKLILLDGKHRLLAMEEFNKWLKENDQDGLSLIETVKVNTWKNGTIDRDEYLEELMIETASSNRKHGDRLSGKDLANQILKIIRLRSTEQLTGLVNKLAKKFGVHQSYINRLESDEGKIGDVLAKKKLSRDLQIYRLSRLGWTQKEIAKSFNLAQSVISENIENMKNHISDIQQQFFRDKKSAEEIARYHNMDLITTWSMILDGKSDEDRFKLFGEPEYQNEKPRRFNVWSFKQRDPRLGRVYEGNIPGQIVMKVRIKGVRAEFDATGREG